MTHVLYRHFDANDRLLYVGRTNSPPRRLREHLKAEHWWADVTSTTYQEFDSLETLKSAERAAIRYEKPKWNIQGAVTATRVRTTEPSDWLDIDVSALTPYKRGEFEFDLLDMHDQQLTLQALSAAIQHQAEESEIPASMFRYDLAWHAHEVWSRLCGEPPGMPAEQWVPRLHKALTSFADLYLLTYPTRQAPQVRVAKFIEAVLAVDEARWYRDWPWVAADFDGQDWYLVFSAPLKMNGSQATYRAYGLDPNCPKLMQHPPLSLPHGPGEPMYNNGRITWHCWHSREFNLPDEFEPYRPV
jgi:hypothetical protein